MNKREMILLAHKADPKFDRIGLANEIGCSRTYVSDVIRDARRADPKKFLKFVKDKKKAWESPRTVKEREEKQLAEITEEVDKMHINTKGKEIRTAEGAMEYCGVDPDEWEISKKVVNFWDMGKNRNWQVKVWLKKKSHLTAEAALERLIKRLPKFKYRTYKPYSVKKSHDSGNMAVIANFDAHLGKLAWASEVGRQGDYDLPIGVDDFDHVTDVNLKRCSMFDLEKIVFIIGQDMMHYENLEGVTPKGRNILDTDGRLAKLQDAAIDVCVRNILKCRAVAPVEVILVQGNHDQTSSLWLSKVLRAWFKDDEHVTFDCEPKLRKARLWGQTFVGLTHQILPSKLAAAQADFSIEYKEMWGKAEFREVLFGDQHKKRTWKTGSQITHGSIMFRQLTALSPIDYWHYENLFTDAVPGGEAFVYNKVTGCMANFTEWTYHRKQGVK